jgi:ribonuclease BN (tRNA processing enzyme)
VKLHFLGTTGYHPNNRRHTACLMLPELGVIFDAGTGMFRVRDLIRTKTLDIFLSHIHLDHCVGLTFLYDVLLDKNLDRVTVHVDPTKIDDLKNHLYASALFPVEPNFEIKPIQPASEIQLNDGSTLTSFPLIHPGSCLGFRIDWNDRSMAYVTDTTACPDAEYLSNLDGINTLIHECYFPDGHEELAATTGHSCLTPVAQVAAKVQADSLYLVHVNPLNEAEQPLNLQSIEAIYSGATVPSDQQVIDV